MFYRAPYFGMPRLIGGQEREDPLAELAGGLRDTGESELADWAASLASHGAEADVLRAILCSSPFLSRAAKAEPAFLRTLLQDGPDATFARVIIGIKDELARESNEAVLAKGLRTARRRAALTIALADLTVHWPLERVTHALSDLANAALSASICHLLSAAQSRGEIVLADRLFPEDGCGYVILAMGKYGARELNYSSDIDLIALFEPAKVDYRGERSVQQFFIGLTQKLGRLINDRIGDGYVFRVDWRLRPDPGATPLAISIPSARAYYKERGETWERAAMIKARPAAGDITLGHAFLAGLAPFVWSDRVDFWNLREIRQLKRRINAHRGGSEIEFFGHNIKIGCGGIREIEFTAQTQQLIYGGNDPYLRCQKTLDALSTLAETGRLDELSADELTEAYEFLRQVEHRLQMINDEQTQTLPSDETDMRRLAGFMGFEGVIPFRDALFHHLHRVAHHYNAFFKVSDEDDASVWDFSPDAPKDDMAGVLADGGFADPAAVYAIFRRWAKASKPGVSDDRGAQAARALVPKFVATARGHESRDSLIGRFDRFVTGLSGDAVSLALLAEDQGTLDLMTTAAARAPALLRFFGERPHLIQKAIEREFSLHPPERRLLKREVRLILDGSTGPERMKRLAALADRVWAQVGAATVRYASTGYEATRAIADLCDAVIVGLGTPMLAIGRYGARDIERLDPAEAILLVEAARGPEERSREFVIEHLHAVSNGFWGNGPISRMTIEDLSALPPGERRVTNWLGLATARTILDEPNDVALKASVVRGLVSGIDGLEENLVQHVDARQTVMKHTGIDPEALAARPRSAAGGLDDLELLVRAHQILGSRRFPDLLGLSTAAALDRLQALELWPAAQVRPLRQAHVQLRRIEGYREFSIGTETLSEPETHEFDRALATAVGVTDRGELMSLLETAGEAVLTAFDRS